MNARLPITLLVQVRSAGGDPLPQVAVTWEVVAGGGAFGRANGLTARDGSFWNTWTLGPAVGRQSARAWIVSGADTAVAVFTADAVESATIEYIDAGPLEGFPGDSLDRRLAVRVRGADGEPLQGIMVRWTVERGAGTLDRTRRRSNLHGASINGWTLGSSGEQRLRVELEGVPGVSPVFINAALLGGSIVSAEMVPFAAGVLLGDTLALRLITRDAAGVAITPRNARWSSAAPGRVAVDSLTGVVRALAPGAPVLITGSSEGVSASLSVTPRVRPAGLLSWTLEHDGLRRGCGHLWGTSVTNVLSACDEISRFDGIRWRMDHPRPHRPFGSVSGNGPANIYVSGPNGTSHFDGTAWIPLSNAPSSRDLWVSPAGHVFGAAWYSPRHFDGATWIEYDVGTRLHLRGVWGTSEQNVYMVGDEGLILHFDGTTWSREAEGLTNRGMRAVWGSGPNDVYAGGGNGVVLRFDGTAWTRVNVGTGGVVRDISGSSPDNVYMVGDSGVVLRGGGTSWQRIPALASSGLTGVWVDPVSGAAFAAGPEHSYRLTGDRLWSFGHIYRDMWGRSDREIYAVGDRGVIARRDEAGWRTLRLGNETFTSVGGTVAGDTYVLGRGFVYRLNGSALEALPRPQGDSVTWMWVAPWGEVFARGRHSDLYRHSGGSWTSMTIPGLRGELGVWGTGPSDLYAVGSGFDPYRGVIHHFDGDRWSRVAVGHVNEPLRSIDGNSPSDIRVLGEYGTEMYYDGVTWTLAPFGQDPAGYTIQEITAMGGRQYIGMGIGPMPYPREVYMVRYDGPSRTRLDLPGDPDRHFNLRQVWASEAGRMHMAGEGLIARADP